ncbi:MAG: hypothetical protein GY839_15705 [candidate division Zixibacteria bacterium]|nr:hypothetical protein [candidate division Zixibacteria bacterium]
MVKSNISIVLGVTICIMLILVCAKSPEFEIVSHWEKNQSHIYSVYTKITDLNKMQSFAETLPYTLGKNTTVCFFKDKELTPDFNTIEGSSWTMTVIGISKSEDFKNCTAWYDRLSSGDDRIVEDPAIHLADGLF